MVIYLYGDSRGCLLGINYLCLRWFINHSSKKYDSRFLATYGLLVNDYGVWFFFLIFMGIMWWCLIWFLMPLVLFYIVYLILLFYCMHFLVAMTRKHYKIIIFYIFQVDLFHNGDLFVRGFPWLPSCYTTMYDLNMVYLDLGLKNQHSWSYMTKNADF